MKKLHGYFIKKENLFDGNYPKVFSIHLNNAAWSLTEKGKLDFPNRVKTVFDILALFGCSNTRVIIQGFHNGITLESILQDSKHTHWHYDLTDRILEILMLRLELKTIAVSEKDSNEYYLLDENLNIVGQDVYGDGG